MEQFCEYIETKISELSEKEKELLKSLLSPAEINSESAISKRLRELAVYGMKRGEKDNMAAIYLLCCRGLFDERGKKKPYGRDDFE